MLKCITRGSLYLLIVFLCIKLILKFTGNEDEAFISLWYCEMIQKASLTLLSNIKVNG